MSKKKINLDALTQQEAIQMLKEIRDFLLNVDDDRDEEVVSTILEKLGALPTYKRRPWEDKDFDMRNHKW